MSLDADTQLDSSWLSITFRTCFAVSSKALQIVQVLRASNGTRASSLGLVLLAVQHAFLDDLSCFRCRQNFCGGK